MHGAKPTPATVENDVPAPFCPSRKRKGAAAAPPISALLACYCSSAHAVSVPASMASTRDFRELVDILSNRRPLPDSKFLTYSLPLTDKQLEELEPLLKDHATLKGLRLKGCRISDEGADVLSRVLAFNTVLEVLELPKNDITSQGALYFANALRQWNHTLRQLDLQGAGRWL